MPVCARRAALGLRRSCPTENIQQKRLSLRRSEAAVVVSCDMVVGSLPQIRVQFRNDFDSILRYHTTLWFPRPCSVLNVKFQDDFSLWFPLLLFVPGRRRLQVFPIRLCPDNAMRKLILIHIYGNSTSYCQHVLNFDQNRETTPCQPRCVVSYSKTISRHSLEVFDLGTSTGIWENQMSFLPRTRAGPFTA